MLGCISSITILHTQKVLAENNCQDCQVFTLQCHAKHTQRLKSIFATEISME